MNEVERESILAERGDQRLQHLERLEIKRKLNVTSEPGKKRTRDSYSSDEDGSDDYDSRRKSGRGRKKDKSKFSALKKDRASNRKRQYSDDNDSSDEYDQEGEFHA
jgi:hypothetical protein